MKAQILVENIDPFLSSLAKALPNHSPVPILLNILIEATQKGMYFSATDLEMGIKVKVAGKIDQEGAVTVPGRQLIEVLNSLPKGKVTFTYEKESLTIDSAGGKIVLQTIPKEEFPNLFEEKGEKVYSFTKTELKDIFSKIIFSASLDDSRAELTGIYIAQKEDSVDFVATDGYRLSLKKIPGKKILEKETGLIVSAKCIQEALTLSSETMDLYVYAQGNQVLFEAEDIVLVGRLIQGNFPNYEGVIPEAGSTQAVIDVEEFAKAIKLSAVFARESANIVRVKIADKQLRLYSRSSGVGEGDVQVAVDQTGEENEIAFNVKFLSDLLRVVDEKRITLAINGPLEAALFTLEKDTNFLHVIMPVRVQE
ncbi:MAG TPA: DNA polymerase III subunit beta [Candidatus Levybacteria bacterium]|nr:DNA polymerase III subunit beta [Candidatus Levybacteria bacterium]